MKEAPRNLQRRRELYLQRVCWLDMARGQEDPFHDEEGVEGMTSRGGGEV